MPVPSGLARLGLALASGVQTAFDAAPHSGGSITIAIAARTACHVETMMSPSMTSPLLSMAETAKVRSVPVNRYK